MVKGGARRDAGRTSFNGRSMTFECPGLLAEAIEAFMQQSGQKQSEAIRYLLGKQLGVKQMMKFDSRDGNYHGVTVEGREIVVDGDTFAETEQQFERDDADTQELFDPSSWEELVGDNEGVRYA